MADRKRKPPAWPNYDPFVRIAKAAGIDLPPLQAAKFLVNHTLFLLAKWAPSHTDKKTRRLWITLAKDCRRCSETLRRINGLILRDVGLLFGGRAAEMAVLRPDRSFIQEVSKFLKLDGKGRASKKPLPLLPLLEDCSDLIRRLGLWTGFAEDRLEKLPKRKSGRRPDYDVKWYIAKLYSIYRASGGKGTVYWNDYIGHFEGPFLNMVAMTLENQTPIRSRDALAQTIKGVLSRPKARRPAEN